MIDRIIHKADHHRAAGDSILILVSSIEHGQMFAERLETIVCHSRMGKKRRAQAMDDFRSGQMPIMIATSLADEGADIPRANVLILAGAGRKASKTEQRAGRVLRAHGDKTHGTIYDFVDRQHPLLARQSRQRQETFRSLGYDIRTVIAVTQLL